MCKCVMYNPNCQCLPYTAVETVEQKFRRIKAGDYIKVTGFNAKRQEEYTRSGYVDRVSSADGGRVYFMTTIGHALKYGDNELTNIEWPETPLPIEPPIYTWVNVSGVPTWDKAYTGFRHPDGKWRLIIPSDGSVVKYEWLFIARYAKVIATPKQ